MTGTLNKALEALEEVANIYSPQTQPERMVFDLVEKAHAELKAYIEGIPKEEDFSRTIMFDMAAITHLFKGIKEQEDDV